MKLPWPVMFADGDTDAWVTKFERIAIGNGAINDTSLLAALGLLLSLGAKAVCNLDMTEGTDPTYQEMTAELNGESKKMIARKQCSGAIRLNITQPKIPYRFISI